MAVTLLTNKTPADSQKLRGGYYTPRHLAEYLASWAIRQPTDSVLEPSAGHGNFIMAVADQVVRRAWPRGPQLVAVEIEAGELAKARARAGSHPAGLRVSYIEDDFFAAYSRLRRQSGFDVVIGNPPFIRFQYFEAASREVAFEHLRAAGYHPTKLANAWAAFVQLSIELLRPGGRLAMVVPAELLQVQYASELRSRLAASFDHIVLIGFRKLVFPEIQQEVVLLLAEGKHEKQKETSSDIHTIEFEDGNELLATPNLDNKVAHVHAKHSRAGMKWTALFLENGTFEALDSAERNPGLVRLGTLADVDVGVVTGRNSFFVLTAEQRAEVAAGRFSDPIVGRTGALQSITFTKGDFQAFSGKAPSFVLNLAGVAHSRFTKGILTYIAYGEKEKVHEGYKCRIRRRWYDVPSIYVPDAFLFRQIHTYPLLVVNEAGAASTDTIHRVRVKDGIGTRQLAAAFFNSLTLAWAEVCGRSYGGGVLELEPREAEELPIPWVDGLHIDTVKVDSLLRSGKPGLALDYVDRVALVEGLGFKPDEVQKVRRAWETLRDRRINRR